MLQAATTFDGDSVTMRNVNVANDTIKVDGSNVAMTDANIGTLMVVVHGGYKYYDSRMEKVTSDGSFVAAMI